MYNTKEKLTTSGIIAGFVLTIVPFYYFIRLISSIKTLKRNNMPIGLTVTSIILTIIYMLSAFTFPIIMIASSSMLFYDPYSYDSYNSSYGSIAAVFIIFLVIFVMISIATLIINIVAGLKLKENLDSDTYDQMSYSDRFELGKCAGVLLQYIPLYPIIKMIMSIDLLGNVNESFKNLTVAFLILIGVSIFLGWIPFLGFLLYLAIIVISIILAAKANDLFDSINIADQEPNNDFTNFTSF